MAALSFSNNGYSTLASGISDVATSVTVQTGHGARFPASNFKVTLAEQSPATGWEVCLCTSRTGDVLTITRAQEGTTGIAFASGDYIGCHVTSGTLDDMAQVGKANSFTAQQTFSELKETVYTITDGAAFEVDPVNGSIQIITLGASRTPKATNFEAGQSVTLMVNDGTAYTLTWTDTTWGTSGVVWVGGSAPTLATSGYTVLEFWKVASQVYGAYVGDVA